MASTWEIEGIPKFTKLNKDETCEVCIVGGGLAGLWCAYLLSREGKRVILIEKDRLGEGATMYTTAFLTHSIDTDLGDIKSMFGRATAKKVWEAHREAIDLIEEVINREEIDCEFQRVNNVIFARDEKELEIAKEENEEAKSSGFESEYRDTPFKGFPNMGGQVLKNQGKYHPMKFFRGLLEAAIEHGLEIYEKTEAVEINGRSIFDIKTKNGKTIRAKEVVVATYDPFNNPKPVHFKKGMYETYVYELKIKGGVIPEGIYEDEHNPYHYFRVDSMGKFDRLIVGGEDHRQELLKPLQNKSFKALREWIDEAFPGLEYTVEKKWHGGILEPSDGLALIGEYAPHRYLASAFSGNGMTYSPISGMLIKDLICGKKNPYKDIFDPKRTMNKKALTYKLRDYGEEFFKGAGKNIFK